MTIASRKLARTPSLAVLAMVVLVFGGIGLAACGSSEDQPASPLDASADGQTTSGQDTKGTATDGTDTDGAETDTHGEDDDDSGESTSNQVELSVPLQSGALIFGAQAVGTTSIRRASVSVRNRSDETASISEVRFTGDASSDFLLADGTTCMPPLELEPGERCSIRVSFAPTRPGERQARLTITVADGVAGAGVSGIGKLPVLIPTPPLETNQSKKADSTDTDTTETSESETTDE